MKLKKFPLFVLAILLVMMSSAHASDSDIYDYAPSFSPYYAGTVKASVLAEALRELNYIRWLAGVPNNVTLNTDFTRKAQHGAVLLDAIDTLTHTPSRPSDMDESFYALGYDSTTHGNLYVSKMIINGVESGNVTLIESLRGYMDDSDSYNISALGHRRWIMNPRLKQTGFGISTRRGYSVTYVIETFSDSDVLSQEEYARYLQWLKWPISDEFITWPTRKREHPLTYFDANTAWSVTLNRDVFETCNDNNVMVTLTRLSDGRSWNFNTSNSDGYFNINKESIAYDECIIFRPSNISSYNSSDTWRVNVSGLTRKDGGSGTLTYTVKFSGSSSTDDTTPSTPTPIQPNNPVESQDIPTPTDDRQIQEIHYYYHEDKKDDTWCNSGFGILSLLLAGVFFGIHRVK